MSRFELVKDASGNPELESLYKEIVEYGWAKPDGVPVNWITSQASRPDILAATWAFTKGTLAHGQLPPTVKQMIAMVIAMQNDCRYCEVAHTNALEAMGVPQDVIQS
jgi:AhpD family alkylhydroperoxidase